MLQVGGIGGGGDIDARREGRIRRQGGKSAVGNAVRAVPSPEAESHAELAVEVRRRGLEIEPRGRVRRQVKRICGRDRREARSGKTGPRGAVVDGEPPISERRVGTDNRQPRWARRRTVVGVRAVGIGNIGRVRQIRHQGSDGTSWRSRGILESVGQNDNDGRVEERRIIRRLNGNLPSRPNRRRSAAGDGEGVDNVADRRMRLIAGVAVADRAECILPLQGGGAAAGRRQRQLTRRSAVGCNDVAHRNAVVGEGKHVFAGGKSARKRQNDLLQGTARQYDLGTWQDDFVVGGRCVVRFYECRHVGRSARTQRQDRKSRRAGHHAARALPAGRARGEGDIVDVGVGQGGADRDVERYRPARGIRIGHVIQHSTHCAPGRPGTERDGERSARLRKGTDGRAAEGDGSGTEGELAVAAEDINCIGRSHTRDVPLYGENRALVGVAATRSDQSVEFGIRHCRREEIRKMNDLLGYDPLNARRPVRDHWGGIGKLIDEVHPGDRGTSGDGGGLGRKRCQVAEGIDDQRLGGREPRRTAGRQRHLERPVWNEPEEPAAIEATGGCLHQVVGRPQCPVGSRRDLRHGDAREKRIGRRIEYVRIISEGLPDASRGGPERRGNLPPVVVQAGAGQAGAVA